MQQAVAQEAAMGGGHSAIRLIGFSQTYLLAGRLEEARTQAENALSLASRRQECGFQAWASYLLGNVAMHLSCMDNHQAETCYKQALSLADKLGMRPLQAHCHHGLGLLHGRAGQTKPARAELTTALEMYREMDMMFGFHEIEVALADLEGQ